MHRTSSKVLLIVAAFVLLLVPVAAIAAGGFTDVEDDSVFKTDIAWLADAGVTKGCNPPTNDRFCPGSNVTREQMAAFMHRLAVNKVVDAKTAMDADMLDGKDSAAFAVSGHDHDAAYLTKSGKAADANLLDGLDSSVFAKESDVYTRADIDSSTSSALVAGGGVGSTGIVYSKASSFGSWTVTKWGTGRYAIMFPGLLTPDCGLPYPFAEATVWGSGFASMGGVGFSCPSGNATIDVWTFDATGAAADKRFFFTAYRGEAGLTPESSHGLGSEYSCWIDAETDIETCE